MRGCAEIRAIRPGMKMRYVATNRDMRGKRNLHLVSGAQKRNIFVLRL